MTDIFAVEMTKRHEAVTRKQIKPLALPWYLRPFRKRIEAYVYPRAMNMLPVVERSDIKLDNHKIDLAILEATDSLGRSFNARPTTLLVGHDYYSGILGGMHTMHYQPDVYGADDIKFLGMNLVLVPWMTGFLLMPDLKK